MGMGHQFESYQSNLLQFQLIFKNSKCAKAKSMLNFKSQNNQTQFHKLADQILRTDGWQLVNVHSPNGLFKQVNTNKIYQLIESNINGNCQQIEGLQHIQAEDDMLANSYNPNSPIFLSLIRISDQYCLYQKSVMSLSERIRRIKNRHSKNIIEEEQILNTFTPILKSISRNQIPPFYQIKIQNILIDYQQNIRLDHPLVSQNQNYHNNATEGMNIYQKLVVIILECLLLNSCDIVKGLVNNHQNIFNMLVERSYSYRIIGLILVLLNQQKNIVSINLNEFLRLNFMGVWFDDLKFQIQKIKIKQLKSLNQYKSLTKTKRKIGKTVEHKQEQQTQDSQNLTITKYRSGKRVTLSRKINQILQDSNDDMSEFDFYKQRKENQDISFNIKKE